MTLYDQANEIGGQFNLAKRIPGKEEFHETLRYFNRMIEVHGVKLKLGQRVDPETLRAEDFDEVVVATGIEPRRLDLPGHDHPKAVSYIDVITGRASVGRKVAIRPGKPLLFARLANGALYFGLPGNPVACAVGWRFFVEPA